MPICISLLLKKISNRYDRNKPPFPVKNPSDFPWLQGLQARRCTAGLGRAQARRPGNVGKSTGYCICSTNGGLRWFDMDFYGVYTRDISRFMGIGKVIIS